MSLFQTEKFYGRKGILSLLKRRFLDLKDGYRQNIALLSRRYVGKSSLLEKFVSDLDDKDIIPVYLNLENKDFPYFYNSFVGSILYHYSKAEQLPLHDDTRLLIESTLSRLPQTHRCIKKISQHMDHAKYSDAYRELIALPEVFSKESDKYCVMILDEFQNFGDMSIPNVFQELGKKIMTQKRCLYVVTSSYPAVAVRIIQEKLSLLFGNFEEIWLEPFDLKTSQEYISFNLDGVPVSETLAKFIVDITGGHPLYIKLICQEVLYLRAVHKQDEIFLPLLTQALENVLFHPWGVIGKHFDLTISALCSGKGNLVIAPILIALSQGKKKIKDLVAELQAKQTHIKQKIERLYEEGLISKNGNFYYIEDRMMKYWIRYVFRKRRESIIIDLEAQRKRFRQELDSAFEQFKKSAQKDMSDRIIDLFHSFEDESFLINGRRYKLPLFRDITQKKLKKVSEYDLDMLKASTPDGDWYIILKDQMFCESDVALIVKELRKLHQRPYKYILISLSDFDENARIKALQERMWLWNEGDLNTLLNIYGKTYIIQ